MGKFLVILVGDLQRRDNTQTTDMVETQSGGAVTTIEAAVWW